MTTIAELLANAVNTLPASDSSRLDAELLLAQAMSVSRSHLYAWPDKEVNAEQEAIFLQSLQRRIEGEPIAYIVGEKEFWSLNLTVNNSTLIPRPETELLVEKILETLLQTSVRLLDLGTGTGAIALALAKERPHWEITAADVSSRAVELAEHNARQLQINNVQCVVSDWFDAVPAQQFDCIVSNPPYIAEDDPHLQQGDVRFEPASALVADNQGMAAIETIVENSIDYLNTNGFLFFEHGWQQAEKVRVVLTQAGFEKVKSYHDLAGIDRVTVGQLLKKGEQK